MLPEFATLEPGSVVIFLDVDGVLATTESLGKGRATREPWDSPFYHAAVVEPACVQRLKLIIEATGAQVVVSSTWRRADYQMAGLKRAFRDGGLNPRETIIDTTPVHVSGDREVEINQWLIQHPEVTRYTSIDDSSVGEIPNVRPSMHRGGLLDEHVEEVIQNLLVARTPIAKPPIPVAPVKRPENRRQRRQKRRI